MKQHRMLTRVGAVLPFAPAVATVRRRRCSGRPLSLLAAAMFVSACAQQPSEPEAVNDAATALEETNVGGSIAQEAATEAAQLPRRVAPIRGQAELAFTTPVTRRTGGEIVTTIKVKNLSETNTIVGLKVDEFWYDTDGEPVTGDQYRHRQALQPLEVIEVVLNTPVHPKMDRNQYVFEHANGGIKTVSVPTL